MQKFSNPVSVHRRKNQQGSALLVVLVFAAIIAIMLYRELPISAFEAQRQKEELLVARGNEYKRGVKLFVRKIGRFPASISELENTNRMRFLRHKFVDPLTGKDDWRLIHAGPGGIITDSKVATSTANKNASTLGQGTTFAGFANSFNGDAAAVAAAAAENTPSAGMRQRPPATKNAASGDTTDPLAALTGMANAPDEANPSAPPIPGQPAIDPATGQPVQTVQSALAAAANANGVTSLADQLNNTNPKAPETAVQPNGLGNTAALGNTPTSLIGNPNGVGTPGQLPPSAQPSTTSPVGNQGAVTTGNQLTTGGGIAGVASNADGKGIKLVNDQKKYKLWEFYYDMRAEQNAGAPGLGQGANTNANGGINQNTNNGQTQSTFGTSTAFGPSTTQQSPVTQPQTQTPPQ
jgi:hypothetical protein